MDDVILGNGATVPVSHINMTFQTLKVVFEIAGMPGVHAVVEKARDPACEIPADVRQYLEDCAVIDWANGSIRRQFARVMVLSFEGSGDKMRPVQPVRAIIKNTLGPGFEF